MWIYKINRIWDDLHDIVQQKRKAYIIMFCQKFAKTRKIGLKILAILQRDEHD